MRMHRLFSLFSLLLLGCGSLNETSKPEIIGGVQAPNAQDKKGLYSATVGLLSSNVNGCTGARLSPITFVSAAHCLEKAANNEAINVYASNSRLFFAHLRNIRIHPSWTNIGGGIITSGSDVATFELAFNSREERAIFDGFVDTVSIDFSIPTQDQPVIVAGFGCERKTGLPGSACEKDPGFAYMKYAHNRVAVTPILVNKTLDRNFRLDASSDKPTADGFTSTGDSGGPTYSLAGKLMAVTHKADFAILTGDDAYLGYTVHAWLGYTDVQSWLNNTLGSAISAPQYYEGPQVTITYANGDNYIGAVRDGFREGQGHMNYKNGRIYTGAWNQDVRKGYGEQFWPAGSTYVSYKGDWINDLPNGRGTLIFTNKLVYTGGFVDFKLQGEGQMTYENGDVRTGHWVNSKREGEFLLFTTDGKKYREQYSNDVRTSIELIS